MSNPEDANFNSLQAHSDLQKQFGAREWKLNLKAAPNCILILAEALLVVSKRETMALDLSGPGVKKLYVDVRDCAVVGIDTFKSTGERMEEVCLLANELGGPGGLIESMMKYLDLNQSEARDRQLKRYVSNSIEKSTGSVNILIDVRKDFEAWRELT
ncbi:uncharacterized protein A1O9_08076 [Exophiala aquamarina CBS 119918]|uniref:Uncharacterized protein n=1 Tax=Exophiala aquamarina CBS 119918 TaxID=1182545 RepID=A0A072PLS5_9EURO|nr:uncharacterized protein A1O9_08076 [Exophiala aquamarina CBS 119918]KEF56495.1 hypothetical protein A1O9_08076 [Exophiala aquamarina CBS 119918]